MIAIVANCWHSKRVRKRLLQAVVIAGLVYACYAFSQLQTLSLSSLTNPIELVISTDIEPKHDFDENQTKTNQSEEKEPLLDSAASIPPFIPPAIKCTSNSKVCVACDEKVQSCRQKFYKEASKQLKIVPADILAANKETKTNETFNPQGVDCHPKLIRYACSEVLQSNSAFACTNDIVVEQLDYHTQFSCIRRIAELTRRKSRTRIPRIGHSVYYFSGNNTNNTNKTFKFHYHLSVLSLIRYLKPSVYFFWNDGLPTGRWWIELLQRVTSPSQQLAQLVGVNDTDYSLRFYSVYRQPPTDVYGTRMTGFAGYHASDVNRIEYLVLFGGVYLDFDAFAVQSLDALLDVADWVMGYELEWCCLNNGVLLGAPNSDFGKLWHCEYTNGYNPEDFTHHSVWRPHTLAQQCPHLIRREARSLNQPNNYGENRKLLYGDNVHFDLKDNYVVHGWMWQYEKQEQLNPDSIKTLTFTLARIWRHLYYVTTL